MELSGFQNDKGSLFSQGMELDCALNPSFTKRDTCSGAGLLQASSLEKGRNERDFRVTLTYASPIKGEGKRTKSFRAEAR